MFEYYSPMYKETEMNYNEILMKDSSYCKNYHLSRTSASYLRYTTDHSLDIQIPQPTENERNPTLNEMIVLDRSPENGDRDSYRYFSVVDENYENEYPDDDDQLNDFEEHQRIFLKKLEEYLDENIPFIINNFFETSDDNSTSSERENLPRPEAPYDSNPRDAKKPLNFTQTPYFMNIDEKFN